MDNLKRRRLSEEEGADRLSDLPDDLLVSILSVMPTRDATRTSLLSHRFLHLWKSLPVVSFTTEDIRKPTMDKLTTKFIPMLMVAINDRNPSLPPLRLNLKYHLHEYSKRDVIAADYHDSVILSLLVKAHALGLRHLTLNHPSKRILHMLPTIFTLGSLDSLSLPSALVYPIRDHKPIFPSTIALTRLRSLSLNLQFIKITELNQLISKLSVLEDLKVVAGCEELFNLSSQTIRFLTLNVTCKNGIYLDLPSLEFLQLESFFPYRSMHPFEVKLPLLKKGIVTLREIDEGDVSAVMGLLCCLSHVEELHFTIFGCSIQKMPYHFLLDPEKDVPVFVNLKYLQVTASFYELNCKDVIRLLCSSPPLRILKLFHEVNKSRLPSTMDRTVRNCWRSKLPRNADGNYRYGYFMNLHLEDKRRECVKQLYTRLGAKRIYKTRC